MNAQGKLLIVDDEHSVRDSLNKWFHEEGYEVGTAESASEALPKKAVLHEREGEPAVSVALAPAKAGARTIGPNGS